jgi:hypothetical protein
VLDPSAVLIASNETTQLYAAYDKITEMLYLAVNPARDGYDRFMMVAFTNHPDKVAAPWGKTDRVPGYDVLISDEGDSDYTGVRGSASIFWSVCKRDGIFEAAIKLNQPIDVIRIRTAEYETNDQGNLKVNSVLPEPGEDRDFIEVSLADLVPR